MRNRKGPMSKHSSSCANSSPYMTHGYTKSIIAHFVTGGSIGKRPPEVSFSEHALISARILRWTTRLIRTHLYNSAFWVERSRQSSQNCTNRGTLREFDG